MMDKNIKMSDIYFAIISRFNNNNTDLDLSVLMIILRI